MKILLESASRLLSLHGSVRFTVLAVAFAIYSNFQIHKSAVASLPFLCWPTPVKTSYLAVLLRFVALTLNLLTLLDTITYGTTKLGIIRAGCVAFAISPRNSPVGIAHLLNKTGTQYIVVTPDLKPLMDATIAIIKEQGSTIPVVQLMPTFKELFPDDSSEDFEYLPEPNNHGPDDPVCILHSSGV